MSGAFHEEGRRTSVGQKLPFLLVDAFCKIKYHFSSHRGQDAFQLNVGSGEALGRPEQFDAFIEISDQASEGRGVDRMARM
ncbi:MAG TPA: hypothetical protein VFJ90_00965 [Candidatus Didemnitutus sp.]|nr:hypothetical protein [Candidatus Didemnitutus sp.]